MNYEERERKIEQRMADKDLNIRVSWAINNAVNLVKDSDNVENEIKVWSRWFITFYEQLRREEVEKIIEKTENETAL